MPTPLCQPPIFGTLFEVGPGEMAKKPSKPLVRRGDAPRACSIGNRRGEALRARSRAKFMSPQVGEIRNENRDKIVKKISSTPYGAPFKYREFCSNC